MRKILSFLLILLSVLTFSACSEPSETPDDGNKTIDVSGVTVDNITVEYDGEVHSVECKNLPEGVLPIYEGNDQTEVGEYTVIIKLIDKDRNILGQLTATIVITEPVKSDEIDLSKVVFTDRTVPYDGKSKNIIATHVPDGVTVKYEGNGKKEVGTYEVTANFFDTNGNLIGTKKATLTITEGSGSGNGDNNDLSNVIFKNTTVLYDGSSKTITATNVPSGVRVEYTGSGINVGTYTITAKFYDSNNKLLATKTATLTITKTLDVELPLV